MATLNEKLKEILGDLYTSDIETKVGDVGKQTVYLWDKNNEKDKDKEPIPKFRVNEMLETSKSKADGLQEQVNALEEQKKENEKSLKDLKKAAEGNEELQKKITDLQDENKKKDESMESLKQSSETKIAEMDKSFKLKEHLLNAGVGDVSARDLLSKNFDLATLEVGEDGKIKGFEDLLKPIKENPAFANFFGEVKIAGQGHQDGEGEEKGKFYSQEFVKTKDQAWVNEHIEDVNKSMEKW